MTAPYVVSGDKLTRKVRSPQHRFCIQNKPWQLQPVAIAPVLPGDTLKNALFQSRCVTDPLKSRLTGWWHETWLFYVKIADLDKQGYIPGCSNIFIDPNANVPNDTTQRPEYMHRGKGVDWLFHATMMIWDYYFCDNRVVPVPPVGTTGTSFSVAANLESWLNSLALASSVEAKDIDLDLDADTKIMASEAGKAMMLYQHLLGAGLTQMTYDDFLASYGIKLPPEESGAPELLRYIKDWTLPANTVEPTTGIPTSACVWTVTERSDKARFFKEPGFLIAMQTCRPKVYFKGQDNTASAFLNDMMNWLPAAALNSQGAGLEEFGANNGPLSSTALGGVGYVYDHRDLFMYGDQFFNVSEAGAFPMVNLPMVSGGAVNAVYPSNADAAVPFKSATDIHWFSEGVITFNIASVVQDVNPRDIGGSYAY